MRADAFCDAALAGIDADHDVVGFGPTASDESRAMLDAERARFDAAAARADVMGYGPSRASVA